MTTKLEELKAAHDAAYEAARDAYAAYDAARDAYEAASYAADAAAWSDYRAELKKTQEENVREHR